MDTDYYRVAVAKNAKAENTLIWKVIAQLVQKDIIAQEAKKQPVLLVLFQQVAQASVEIVLKLHKIALNVLKMDAQSAKWVIN